MMLSSSARPSAASVARLSPQSVAARPRQQAAQFSLLPAAQRPRSTQTRAAAPAAEATETPSAPVGFKNVQKFLVPKEAEAPFQEAWKERAAYMETMDGFVSFNITQSGKNFSVESVWLSIPAWEKFNLSAEARRQHLPSGIWQFVPKAGEGFPEDFVPFYDIETAVSAKYPKKR